MDDTSDPKETQSDRLRRRFGHAHIASRESLLITSLADYRLPGLIRHLITNRHADGELQVFNLEETAHEPSHLAFRNQGTQISFSALGFQLTAGGGPYGYGRDKDDLAQDFEAQNGLVFPVTSPLYHLLHPIIVSRVDDKAQQNAVGVRATTLIPTLGARRPNAAIAFYGADKREWRRNTCVAPNFLCGLNPVFPPNLIAAGKCPAVNLPADVDAAWKDSGGPAGPLGCALTNVRDPGVVPTIVFERGMVQLWDIGSGNHALLMAWTVYDGKNSANDRIYVRWKGAPVAFQYFVKPYKDGAELVAHSSTGEVYDSAGHGWTGGSETFDPSASPGMGRWDFEVVGCQPYERIQYNHGATDACKIWSPRISVSYSPTYGPVDEPPIACDAARAEMPSGASVLMLDAHGQCSASRYGFYMAVVLDRCERPPCSDNGSLFGLIEAVPAENYADFAAFQSDFRARNGTRTYRFDALNQHKLPSGDTIDFNVVPADMTTWAIRASSDPAIDSLARKDLAQWPRAAGPVIENDGHGKVKIKNGATGEIIQYDWTSTMSPRTN